MIHEPFQIGDFISVTGIEGTVGDIQARATLIKTAEGREVFIPNATLFTNPVAVSHNGTKKPEANQTGLQASEAPKKT